MKTYKRSSTRLGAIYREYGKNLEREHPLMFRGYKDILEDYGL